MPIDVKCPGCRRGFRVPDKYAGKRIKCPQCQGRIEIPGGAEPEAAESTPKAEAPRKKAPQKPAVEIPGGAQPKAAESTPKAKTPRKKAPQKPAAAKPEPVEEWHVQTEEGEQYGPVSKEELDEWVTDARLDASCQLLREGWPQWKWAEEVYPELGKSSAEVPEVSEVPQIQSVPPPVPSEPAENPFAGIGEAARAAPAILPAVETSRTLSPVGAAAGQAAGDGTAASMAMRRTLANILRPWLLFMAVMGFIGGAFATYAFIRVLVELFKTMSRASRYGGDVPWQVIVLVINLFASIGAVVLYVIAAFFLLGFQQRMDAFLRLDQQRELRRAMTVYKQFWLFMFIATGIMVTVNFINIILLETIPG